ncbi:hypothetical protein F4703DRAFT_1141507 [Phycomyces blakesleeanus]
MCSQGRKKEKGKEIVKKYTIFVSFMYLYFAREIDEKYALNHARTADLCTYIFCTDFIQIIIISIDLSFCSYSSLGSRLSPFIPLDRSKHFWSIIIIIIIIIVFSSLFFLFTFCSLTIFCTLNRTIFFFFFGFFKKNLHIYYIQFNT